MQQLVENRVLKLGLTGIGAVLKETFLSRSRSRSGLRPRRVSSTRGEASAAATAVGGERSSSDDELLTLRMRSSTSSSVSSSTSRRVFTKAYVVWRMDDCASDSSAASSRSSQYLKREIFNKTGSPKDRCETWMKCRKIKGTLVVGLVYESGDVSKSLQVFIIAADVKFSQPWEIF